MSRKGRSIVSASQSSKAIKDLKRILSQNILGNGKIRFGSLDSNILQNLTKEYKFTNKSNLDILRKLERNVRDNSDLKPADGPKYNTMTEFLLQEGPLVAAYGAASQVAGPAFANIYDGDNSLWRTYRPDSLLTPTNPLWIKEFDPKETNRYESMNLSGSKSCQQYDNMF